MQVCEAVGCEREAERVISGHAFCKHHRDGALVAETPLVLCAVPDCGSPALRHGEQPQHCRHHQKFQPAGLRVVAAAAIALFCGLAAAPAVAGGVTAATVSTVSGQALAAPTAGPGWRFVVIDNESATATVACTFDGTGALNTAGSFTVLPEAAGNVNRLILGPFVATIHNAIDCIASPASTPVTILVE